MWKARALVVAFALLPALLSATPKQLWIAYYVRFVHAGHTDVIQSRALWTEGADLVAHGGHWKFHFLPKVSQITGDSGTLQFSVVPAKEPKKPEELQVELFMRDLPFQMGSLMESRYKDENFDFEVTFIVSPGSPGSP